MIRLIFATFAAVSLVACGVDGSPTAPEVSAKTSVGVNSKTGVFTQTEIGISVKLN